MKILLFTEKADYIKVIGLLVEEIDSTIEIESISACQLANVSILHPHDLIILDDRLCDHLNGDMIEVMTEYQMDVIVFLKEKKNIHRYLTLNLLDYFVSPLKWTKIEKRLLKEIKRLKALNHLDTGKKVPNRFIIKQKNEIHLVDFNDIFYFEKCEKKVRIHTREQILDTHESLKKLLERLPEAFVRVHSSFIVNFNNAYQVIEEHRTYRIYFKNYEGAAHMSRKKADEMLHDHINMYRLSYIEHHRKEH